jgi:hypothetical protein
MASRPPQHELPVPLALVFAGLALAETLVLIALLAELWLAAGLLHTASILSLGPLLRATGATDPTRRGGALPALRVTAALLPALGLLAVAGGLTALLLRSWQPAPPAPLPEDPMAARLAAMARPQGADGPPLPPGFVLEALADVLRWGTQSQRMAAVDLAARGERGGAEAVLLLALRDPDPALRSHAEAVRPAAARRLMAALAQRRAALTGSRFGSDPRIPDATRRLALAIEEAVRTELLDPDSSRMLQEEAVALWRALALAQPGDVEVEAAVGRGLLRLNRLTEARAALEAAMARGVVAPGVVEWLAECLFRLRDFGALDALIAAWRPLLETIVEERSSPLAPVWRLWLARAA